MLLINISALFSSSEYRLLSSSCPVWRFIFKLGNAWRLVSGPLYPLLWHPSLPSSAPQPPLRKPSSLKQHLGGWDRKLCSAEAFVPLRMTALSLLHQTYCHRVEEKQKETKFQRGQSPSPSAMKNWVQGMVVLRTLDVAHRLRNEHSVTWTHTGGHWCFSRYNPEGLKSTWDPEGGWLVNSN